MSSLSRFVAVATRPIRRVLARTRPDVPQSATIAATRVYSPVSDSCQIPELATLHDLFFGQRSSGFFVEVGVYDGESFSNSSRPADRGWAGVLIELVPTFAQKCRLRHGANTAVTVAEVVVGADAGEVTLHVADALITSNTALLMPGNVPGAESKYPPIIGPGEVEMDGTMALGYVQSRAADSDYSRMGRQRRLLETLASQTSGSDVLLKFPALADAMKENIRTSLTPSEFAFLADRLRSGANIQESVGLTPPLVQPGRPDYGNVADLIDALQDAIKTGADFPFA